MKKVVNVLLATTLATSSIAVLPNAALADSAVSTVERIGGINRYETCVDISKKSFDNSDVAILASGQKVHDALTSGGIAAKLKAPLLLTKKDTLPNVVMDELKRLKVKKVIFVGGEQSISKSVENELAKTFKVQRVSGKDRYETSIKLAEELNKTSKQENIIVNANTVDALSAGAVAAKLNRSIILTDGKNLPEGSKSIVDINSSSNVIIGGTDSMNIKGLKGDRISGINRYETSTKIAEKYYQGNNDKVLLANGTNYIDALSAINLVLSKKAPVLLAKTDALDASVSKYLEKNAKGAYLLGGEDSISASLSKNIEKTIKDAQPKDSKRTDDKKNENKKPDNKKPDNNNPDNKKPDNPVEYDEVKVLKDGRYEVEAPGYSKIEDAGKNNKLIAIVEGGKIKNIEFEYHDTDMDMFKNPFNKNKDKLFDKLKNNGYFLSADKADKLSELNTIADKLYKKIYNRPDKSSIDKINKDHGVDIVTSATYTTASLYKGSYELLKRINDDAEIKKVPRPKKTDKLNLVSKENFAKLDENTKYEDGVYYGDGFGYIDSKPIPLKVTVEAGKIKSVEFLKEEVQKVLPGDSKSEVPDDGEKFIKGYEAAITLAKSGETNRLNYFLKSARNTERKVISEVKKSTNDATLEAYNKVLDDLFSKHEFGTQKLRLEQRHFDKSIPHVLESRLNSLTRTYMNEDLDYRYNVDTISGATYTATGTIEAIANALKKADPSVDFTNLTIPKNNGLQPSYKGGSEIDFDKIGFKAEILKKGQTSPIDVPFKDFEKHGIKLCYVDHSTGELKEIKGKLKLTKENLGYDTKNGLALRLVHEKTNTVKLIKSIQIFDNTKIQCTVEKVQVSEVGKNNWKDVNGFDNKLDPKSQQLDFDQKLTMPEETSNSLKGKKIEFRLVTKREDNKSEKIFNLKSDSVIEWPTFNDSGYYALTIDKDAFTSGSEQYKLDQPGIDNFRFYFKGIKSGEFKEAVDEFEKKGYEVGERTITLDKDYANESNMEVLEKLAKEKVDAKFIKGAFPSTISKKGKELLESANVDVDNTAIAKAFKSAATKPQIKVDVKFEFADGSSYKFKLPIYIEIKKEKKHLQLKFEEAIKEKKVQLLQTLPDSFKANNEVAKKSLEAVTNIYGKLDKDKLAVNIKTTYSSATDNLFVEKVEIADGELEKIDTNNTGVYNVKATVKLKNSEQEETRGVFDIPFEVVKYQVVGFNEFFTNMNKISKLEYGPEENINIVRDSGKYLGYWLYYSIKLGTDGQWNPIEFNNLGVNSLDDLKLFTVDVVKGEKDTYTKDDIVDLTKPAKDILDADKPTKLYLYNFGESKNNNHPQKILIGEFTLKK
ncbi:MAG: cell wall-binding repeat-containing protein [Peptoanaerobacter stomatis]|uniref:cell wall-binding repeat-containing protein n=1 Tax=Peptoanaerobacter stomatis TaxID=796937 RepID=UPI003FA052F0